MQSSSAKQTTCCHGNQKLEWPSVFTCWFCLHWPLLCIGASLGLCDTLPLPRSQSWMNRISAWEGETADCLLRVKNNHSGSSKASWTEDKITIMIKRESTSLRRTRRATSIWMLMEFCECSQDCSEGGCLSSCWFYYVYSSRQMHGSLSENIPSFLRPWVSYSSSMGSCCHRSPLIPQLCTTQLHCHQQRNFSPMLPAYY